MRDPVRVTKDHRVVWYPSGRVGDGARRSRRCGSDVAAQQFARQVRGELTGAALDLDLGSPNKSVRQMIEHFLTDRELVVGSPLTTRQYRSNLNVWTPAVVQVASCGDVDLRHWHAIFDGLRIGGASAGTVKSVARTYGALIQFGALRGYLSESDAFGSALMRRKVVHDCLKYVSSVRAQGTIALKDCPTADEVDGYAAAFEAVYPGHGRLLVLLAFSSGLRFCELLALRVEDINLLTGEVRVAQQLDRTRPWPATRLPKGGKSRIAVAWAAYRHVLKELVETASGESSRDPGYLFPRYRSKTAWADQAGRLAGAAAASCPEWSWGFHALRHSFATHSLAPVSAGGYGLPPKSVSTWLGHHALSLTLDMYVDRLGDDVSLAGRLTAKRPGT